MRPLDGGMLLALAYEIPSLTRSQYTANGLMLTKVVFAAVLFYFLVRLVSRTSLQRVATCLLIAAGGVVLTWFAFSQFAEQVHAIEGAGLGGLVAFRARLIIVPMPWVVGEWFTLLLLTFPFAVAVPAFLWFDQRRLLAAGAALLPVVIVAGLLLSCSRAVFWGLVVFAIVVVGTAAAYRTIRVKAALVAIAGVLAAFGLVLATENVFYPGIAEAYMGRHTSQVRSTEGG